MRVRFAVLILIVSFAAAALPGSERPVAPVAFAEVVAPPPAPAVGSVLSEQPLSETDLLRDEFCPTGRASGRMTETGYQFVVNGRCVGQTPLAGMQMPLSGLMLLDGDLEFEVAGEGALERATISLTLRFQARTNGYQVQWTPSAGVAQIRRLRDGQPTSLARRSDLPQRSLADGARFSVRAQGATIWLLVDGEPMLAATDKSEDAIDSGLVAIGLIREGNPDGDEEVRLTIASVRISQLADSSQDRLSSFQSGNNGPFRPAPGSPPAVGAVMYQESMNQREIGPYRRPSMFVDRECPTGNGSISFVGEGLRYEIHGKCYESSRVATIGLPPLPFINIPDGELRFEFRIRSDLRRAFITVGVRAPEDEAKGVYFFIIGPHMGLAGIERLSDGQSKLLTGRSDIGGVIKRGDWNSLAIRMHGSSLWLLLNDQPVVSAEDNTFTQGSFFFDLRRDGSTSGDESVEAIFRNLTVSEIKGSPKNRKPHGMMIDMANLR